MKNKKNHLSLLKVLVVALGLFFASASAQNAAGVSAAPVSDASTIRTPLFLGASLGFGSGTGVGTERGLGLRQIEPMLGVWLPGLGFARVGYGFFDFNEEADDGDDYEVEHSDFDIELGVHLLGQLYLVGNYSRVKELSDLGDVAWNEWGAGFGSLLHLFGKGVLFAEVSYRWVLEHYDPFVNKKVSGSRLQFNIGFITYVF
jgi:hypothetical protein